MIEIKRLINSPIPSNCYLIIDKDASCCIIIDPGSLDGNSNLERFINDNKLTIKFVILTHEHFDHIGGVNTLQSSFQFDLLCSLEAAKALTDSKKNLSAYNDQMESVNVNITPVIAKENEEIYFAGNNMKFHYTPGHSPGSMCFSYGNHFFSGDTLLHNQKARLNLPGGDKRQYEATLEKLKTVLFRGMLVNPGHGNAFTF